MQQIDSKVQIGTRDLETFKITGENTAGYILVLIQAIPLKSREFSIGKSMQKVVW